MGLIDTFSAGFDRTAKRLWLVLLPALLDAGIWLGPRLSLDSLSQRALQLLPDITELGAQYAQAVEISRLWLADVGRTANLLALLSMQLLGFPGLAGSVVLATPALGLKQVTIEIPSGWAVLGISLLLVLLGLFIGCVALSLIAADARDGQLQTGYALRVAWRSWVRLTLLLVCTGLLGIVLLFGIGMFAGLVGMISVGAASLILSLVGWTLLSVSVYGGLIFYFTSRSIVLDDMGIFRSIWSAFNVVHRNFLSSVGFVLLVNILHTGLLYIWRLLAVSTAGMMVGIVGNAYVNTGLVMASFIFYRDRFAAWQKTGAQKGQP